MNNRQMRRQLVREGLGPDEVEDRLADNAEREYDDARDRELEETYKETP